MKKEVKVEEDEKYLKTLEIKLENQKETCENIKISQQTITFS